MLSNFAFNFDLRHYTEGNFDKVAVIYFRRGSYMKASEIFEKAGNLAAARRTLLKHVRLEAAEVRPAQATEVATVGRCMLTLGFRN